MVRRQVRDAASDEDIVEVRSKLVRSQVRERTPEKQLTDEDIVEVRSKVVRSQVRTAASDSEIVEVRSQVRTATSEKEIIETAAHYRDVEMFSNHVEFSLVEYEDAEAFGTEGKFYLSECAAKVYGKPPNDVLKKIRELEKAYVAVFGLEGNFSLNEYTDPIGRKLPVSPLNFMPSFRVDGSFLNIVSGTTREKMIVFTFRRPWERPCSFPPTLH